MSDDPKPRPLLKLAIRSWNIAVVYLVLITLGLNYRAPPEPKNHLVDFLSINGLGANLGAFLGWNLVALMVLVLGLFAYIFKFRPFAQYISIAAIIVIVINSINLFTF